jgi:hypothetical protein
MGSTLTPADDTNRPDPSPDRPVASTSSRTGRLLNMVRRLMQFGANLAITLRQSASMNDVSRLIAPFGTKDIGLILARITRGLLLAATLEGRVISHPLPEKAAEKSSPGAPARKPRPARSAEQATRRVWVADPRLAALPTEEEIAAEVRRRPVGAVLADICRDLGITPTHVLWREVSAIISENGGTTMTLFNEFVRWMRRPWFDRDVSVSPALGQPFPPAAMACGTGPPRNLASVTIEA